MMFAVRKYISVVFHLNEDKEVEKDKSRDTREQKTHAMRITYLKYKFTSFVINFTRLEID